MKAIYKRELHSYLTTMVGAVAIAVGLFIMGFLVRQWNFYSGYASVALSVYAASSYFYIICMPLLTMKLFAEERKLKTDQLLLTSPVSPVKIVMGKYLALITTLLIPTAVLCVYPLITARFGDTPFRIDYASILLFYLMGCAYFAVGMFISTLTESTIIAAIVSLLFAVLTLIISNMSSLATSNSFVGLVVMLIICVLIGILVYVVVKNYWAWLITTAGLFIAAVIVYRFNNAFYVSNVQNILNIIDFRGKFSNVVTGTFFLGTVVFFLSYVVIFIMLSVRSVGEKTKSGGGWMLATTASVIASIIVVNMIVSAIPSRFTTYDLTDNDLYSIGDVTKGILDDLDEDVNLYFLAEPGHEDTTVQNILNSYEGYSNRIKVSNVDMIANPNFAKQFTDETLTLNSIIAECNGKSKAVPSSAMFPTETSYTTGNNYTNQFDGEGQITSAISYVTSDQVSKALYTDGHNETLFTDMEIILKKENIDYAPINLMNDDIDPDCSAVIICAPTTDFSEEEIEKLKEYYDNGGHLWIDTGYDIETLTNLQSLLEYAGITVKHGLVVEADTQHYTQEQYILMPDITRGSEITADIAAANMVYPLATAIDVTGKQGFTSKTLLQSTKDSYTVESTAADITKKPDSEEGPFTLAATVEANDGSSKMVVFTSAYAFEKAMIETLLSSMPEPNTTMLKNSINFMVDNDSSVSIDAKSTDYAMITITQSVATMIGNILMFAVPAVFLAAGLLIWFRRRGG